MIVILDDLIDIPISAADALAVAKRVVRKGVLTGSLESEETAGLDYYVLDGLAVGEHFPELAVSVVPLVSEYAEKLFGPGLDLVNSSVRAVNLNILTVGQRYEKHVDGNSVTAIVFGNDNFQGGDLIVEGQPIRSRRGRIVIFHAGRMAHEVTPVTAGIRMTMPISFEFRSRKSTGSLLEQELY